MAIVRKVTQPGDFQVSTLNGRVRLEADRLANYDADGRLQSASIGPTELKFRADGTAYFMGGVLADNIKGDLYAKEGIDARDVFI